MNWSTIGIVLLRGVLFLLVWLATLYGLAFCITLLPLEPVDPVWVVAFETTLVATLIPLAAYHGTLRMSDNCHSAAERRDIISWLSRTYFNFTLSVLPAAFIGTMLFLSLSGSWTIANASLIGSGSGIALWAGMVLGHMKSMQHLIINPITRG